MTGLAPLKQANSDIEQPLLDKQGTETEAVPHPDTLFTLFRYSSADAPLLLIAFTAGKPMILSMGHILFLTYMQAMNLDCQFLPSSEIDLKMDVCLFCKVQPSLKQPSCPPLPGPNLRQIWLDL